jgi:hypothetical protein
MFLNIFQSCFFSSEKGNFCVLYAETLLRHLNINLFQNVLNLLLKMEITAISLQHVHPIAITELRVEQTRTVENTRGGFWYLGGHGILC